MAIDTTGDCGSLALAEDEKIIEAVLLQSTDGFAHILFEHIGQLLRRHDLQACDISCFAAASGPGSFTGVRAGLAAAKGLAEACGKPLVSVSNLQAMAAGGTAPLRAAVIDARRGEVYTAVFDESLQTVVPETVGSFSDWLQTLPDVELEFLSADSSLLLQALSRSRFAHSPVLEVEPVLAPAVARIATVQYARGEALDPAAIDANYVRRSDAELFTKK